jgi:hypothetical protein
MTVLSRLYPRPSSEGEDPEITEAVGRISAIVTEHEVCYHCDQALSDPCIAWFGLVATVEGSQDTVTIYFHPGCALAFLLRLAADVRRVETLTNRAIVGPQEDS